MAYSRPVCGQTAASYSFSAFTRAYHGYPFTGWTGLGQTFISTSDNLISRFPIGFSFSFCGVTYDSISACSNGFIALQRTSAAPYTNTADSITGAGMLMTYWDRLYGYIPSYGYYATLYEDTGIAPNRIFCFEWGTTWFPYSYLTGSGTAGRFQVRLYESTNVIEFCYSTSLTYGSTFSGTSATIGIANSTTDWQTLNNSGPSPVSSPTVFTDSLSVGPAAMQVYRFTPPPCNGMPAAGTVSATVATGCAAYSSVLLLSGATSLTGIGYQWQSSADSATWANISGATSLRDTVTVSSTTYYRCVVTCAAGGVSAYTAGVRLALVALPLAATSNSPVCNGAVLTLFASPDSLGETFNWSGPASFSSTQATPVLTGFSGADTGYYNVVAHYGACTATSAIHVLPGASPAPITGGTAIVCAGGSLALGNSTSGGIWSSSNTTVATADPAAGTVYATAAGTTTVTYTLPTGCNSQTVVTVDALPGAIAMAATAAFCQGTMVNATDGSTGGTWSSSSTVVATIAATGAVYGVAAGTAVVTYTLPTGCIATTTVTVNPSPGYIMVPATLCLGYTTAVGAFVSGGAWSSSNTSVITVWPVPPTGEDMTASAPGLALVSYTLPDGCATTDSVTVYPAMGAIAGTAVVCTGLSTALSISTTGGSWSSSNTAVATVNSATGLVSGIAAGIATIGFTTIYGCTASVDVTVSPVLPAITGIFIVCLGQATTLHDVTTGGAWSTPSANATVDITTGVVTGSAAGVATIVYTTPAGCSTSTFVTVNTSPGTITGNTRLCAGGISALSDAGGGSWVSSNTAVATIGSTGIVSGITVGSAMITYSLGAGCSATTMVTVNAPPPAISGTAVTCAGSTTALADGGGTWSSIPATVAAIGSATGVVNGVAGGTAAITFTSAVTGCAAYTTVTINPLPAAISGGLTVCPGATSSLRDLTTGGIWSSSNTIIATLNTTGTLYGAAPGTSSISYTIGLTGCSRSVIATVSPLPSAITGTMNVCAGATTNLSDASTGGLWTTSASAIATIGSAGGIVSGVNMGTVTVSYTAGCTRTTIVTVNQLPAAILGPTAECVGATIAETTSAAGGSWISTTTGVATVGSAGVITGVATGTTVIKYTTTAGCTVLTTITVSLSPTAITGPSALCANDTASLTDAVGGGVWSSSNTFVATAGSLNGLITGAEPGATTITYSLGTGCTVTKTMTINALPSAITGTMSMCAGATITLADVTTGGTWSSNNMLIATIIASGNVTGAVPGIDTIKYTHAGCAAIALVTVNGIPSTIAGTSLVCTGSGTTLTDAVTGGTWMSSNTSIASVSATGMVTGGLPGTTTITYSLGAGCTATKIVTVSPVAAITGGGGMCVGTSITLADAVTGGTWGSGAATIAGVNATSGIVNGLMPGTALITYTTTGGCTATTTITVNLAPSAINGSLHVCTGATTALSNTAGGGIWTSTNTAIATIGSAGTVTGIAAGTGTISYSLGGGCITTAVVTVNPGTAAITGTLHVCIGSSVALANVTTGGIWSSASVAIATINSGGMITGRAAGTAVISYSTGGCAATAVVTVDPLPMAISSVSGDVCAGQLISLTNGTSGGTWISSSTTIATIDTAGNVTGASAGEVSITYTLPTGCIATARVTVNATPLSIYGTRSVCTGATTELADITGSGVWSSSNTLVATITTAGVVTGGALGTASISYTAAGCSTVTTVTINALPAAISGIARVCAGDTVTLSDTSTGGAWSSATTGIATVNEITGVVTGVVTGTTSVTYSVGAGCAVSVILTVNPVPLPIAGTFEVCLGYITSLSDVTTGGVWSSINTSIAVVGSTGMVNGVTGGGAVISYTNSIGCSATHLVTVMAVPPILGVTNMCSFNTALQLYDSAGGGIWTSSLVSVDSTGLVTPYATGIAMVTYTLPGHCYITATLTVNPSPGPILGSDHICRGNTLTLSDTSSTGAWNSTNTSIAAVSGIGVVSGIRAGVDTIQYVLPTGCATNKVVVIDTLPVIGAITGPGNVCIGASVVLSDATAGGAWSSANTRASVVGGAVNGLSVGTDIISYTVGNSCGMVAATTNITINPLPVAGAISGLASVCAGDSITLIDATTGGAWSTTNGLTTVLSGVVAGVSYGADTVNYTVTNSCGAAIAAKIVTVNILPDIGTISSVDTLCAGASFTLIDTATGGVWTSSNDHISITSAGAITAGVPGVDTITYALTNVCGTSTYSLIVAVKAGPIAGSISGNTSLCSGAKDTLTAAPTGGSWSSSNDNATITTIASGAIITGVTAGADTIMYTISNDCGAASATLPITVNTIDQCDSMTGVKTYAQQGALLQVWPNPNDGIFTVTLSSANNEPVQITITNIVGEKIKEAITVTNKPTEIKLGAAAGVYFINATTANGKYVAKVVFAE